ncbi:U7 snRNA-associated Sm-like protein LSm11 [Drosophila guanche]|uniref:Blast:U7 snRNA-associated Sm-like protein LSm11 n=1 Tax=Drosophila guanche TaxID=7266 RepID=A0A3B0JQV4_DROGU|nr:U7 snRNA-associated Sm-like protein LSm11 [Drosophila guanche]SPP75746.1 blast:U7 snRNA-associated Sm-like protein LSm11 [Drosophila guanche]
MESSSEKREVSAATDPELDVSSELFNPLRALYEPNYRITEVPPKVLYQNIAAFESALKKFGVWQLNKRQKSGTTAGPGQAADKKPSLTSTSKSVLVLEDVPRRRFEPHQLPTVSTLNKKHQRNIFTYMETAIGPLELLKKCIVTPASQNIRKIRVRVVLRKERAIGGSVVGELVAYDKQWNLLLRNATETWQRRKYNYGEQKICGAPIDCTERLRDLGIALPAVEVKSLNRKNVQIVRHLPQILIRGENVVLLSLMV